MPEPGTVIKRPRKPRPRHPDVIIAAIDERQRAIPRDDTNQFHFDRLEVLLDELQRSLNGKPETAEESE